MHWFIAFIIGIAVGVSATLGYMIGCPESGQNIKYTIVNGKQLPSKVQAIYFTSEKGRTYRVDTSMATIERIDKNN